MKKQYLDFKVVWDFFIEMNYYTIQNYFLISVGMLDFAI